MMIPKGDPLLIKTIGKRRITTLFICLIIALTIFFGAETVHAQHIPHVETLLTNGVENPMAIDVGAPEFSWKIASEQRDCMQEAYQIVVTAQRDGETVWDSGKIESTASSGVMYSGPALSADTPYRWKVKVWTNQGISAYSADATFRAGLMNTDWTAQYIWDATQKANDYAYLRKSFPVADKPVLEAIVYTSAHNDYQLYLNGDMVGVGPARSDPYTYGQYCAYDITDRLVNGTNTFASLVHWHGVWSNSGANAQPAYILEARIRYTDGSMDTVITDDSWKLLKNTPYIEGAPTYFGMYGGINNRASIKYDARKEIAGWNSNTFDDSGWERATNVDRQDFSLYAQLVGEQAEHERVVPVSVTNDGDNYLVDFGKCLTGWPEIKLRGNVRGSEVKVQYWEVERGWGDAGYDTHISKGGEEIIYAPYVRHTSFRILEISGYTGQLDANDVRGVVAYSAVQREGSFESSDQRLNDIYVMAERSGRQNYQQGIISVDANREQSPWTADSWNIGIGYLYNYADTMAIDKIIKDYAGEQLDSGNFLACSPAPSFGAELAEWSLYWPMLLWEQHLFSGSEKLVNDYYPNLTRFLDNYIASYRNLENGLYDPPGWRASDYAGGTMQDGGENIATNCQIYRNFEIAAQIARITGHDKDVEKYAGLANDVRSSINHYLFVNGESYKTTPDSTQIHPLGTAWALRFDLVPHLYRDSVIEWMASQKDNYDVGGYGGDALYNGLYTAGLGNIATKDFERYDRMLNTNNTIWESFGELSDDNMGNHAWTAYPSYLLQKYVGGITPTSGGFATFDVKPVIQGLEYAAAKVPTAKGVVISSWEKADDQNLTLKVTVPANTVANIYVPDGDMYSISVLEGEVPVYQAGAFIPGVPGLHGGRRSEGYIVFEAGSGDYSFSVFCDPLRSRTPEI